MRALLASLLLALGLAGASAHEQRIGPRGGMLVDAGSYHIELVTSETMVEIHLSDAQDKPLPAAGFKALAILAVDGKSTRITLEPAPDGAKLVGKASDALPKRVKGAVQLTAPDGRTSTGRIN